MAKNKIRAGDAFVRLFIEDGEFRRTLTSASKRLSGFGDSLLSIGPKLAGMGAAITGPLALAVKQFASAGDELNKMSIRTGFAVESLSELAYAASQSGASLKDFEAASRGMARALLNAGEGSLTAVEAFRSLGLSVETLQSLTPEAQFNSIAAALAGIEDPTLKAGLAMRIFGKSGTALIPLLNNGSEGMDALRKQAIDLGIVLSTEDAQAAADLTDALDKLSRQTKAIFQQIAAAVAGPLTQFAGSTRDTIRGVIDWTRENGAVVASIAKLGVVLTVAGGSLTALGLAFKGTAAGIAALQTSVHALSAAFTLMLAHPVVAAIAAITVAVAAVYVAFKDAAAGAKQFDDALRDLESRRLSSSADDVAAMTQRFEQLAAKTKLTREEAREAYGLFVKLRDEFGSEFTFGIDYEEGKITGAAKALAQLNAARQGPSIAVLKNQETLIKASIDAAKNEGASAAELDERTRKLAEVQERISRMNRIIRDAAPTSLPTAPETAAEPTKPEEDKRPGFFGGAITSGLEAAKRAQTSVGDAVAGALSVGLQQQRQMQGDSFNWASALRDEAEKALDKVRIKSPVDAVKDALEESTAAIPETTRGPSEGAKSVFDATFASQLFAGRDDTPRRQLKELEKIAKNTEKKNANPFAVGAT